MPQKKVYRQKLINGGFIFMLIWTAVFTAIVFIGIHVAISEGIKGESPWNGIVGAIACSVMSSISWILFAPMLIHRKKILIKDGMLHAHFMIPKVYDYIVGLWHGNSLSHLTNPSSEFLRLALEISLNRSDAKIARFSWIVRWQCIDLSQIVAIRQRDTSIPVMSSLKRAVEIDVIMLRDRYGGMHIVEITDFSDKAQEEIFDLIEESINTYLPEDVRPVNNPRPQTKRQKREAKGKLN